jgi:hypothetical protein
LGKRIHFDFHLVEEMVSGVWIIQRALSQRLRQGFERG